MNIYEVKSIGERLAPNPYPGRGVILGMSANGKKAVAAYFIMGRSANSRNRIFTEKDGAVFTEPFDASKVEDPSLIIYAAIRKIGSSLIVTNGDQTDTVYRGLAAGMSFPQSLESRRFEPDAPNFTPRISGLMTIAGGACTYEMSILKSGDAEGSICNRYCYRYEPKAGLGHFIHTYACDGTPLPTFQGEPERICIPDDIDAFAQEIWENLNEENKISLYVRYIDLATGAEENRLINKNH